MRLHATGCAASTSSSTSQPQPGPAGHDELAVADLRHRGRQLLAPGDVVDVDLEQPHVRDRGAPLRGDERREVAVVVVRRAGDLVGLGERRDLERLREPVPDHVDRGDVHRVRLEVRAKAAQRVEVLARAERDRRAASCVRERAPRRRSRPRARRGRTARAPARHATMPSVVRLKLRSTIGCAAPPVPSRNASSSRVSASSSSGVGLRSMPPSRPKPGISTRGSSPGTTMFVLNAR